MVLLLPTLQYDLGIFRSIYNIFLFKFKDFFAINIIGFIFLRKEKDIEDSTVVMYRN